jgi:hypothetical protein
MPTRARRIRKEKSSYALRGYCVTGESEGEEWREGLPQKGARSREKETSKKLLRVRNGLLNKQI